MQMIATALYVQRNLEPEATTKLFQGFHNNYLKGNSTKSYFMSTTDDSLQINGKGNLLISEKQ